MGRSVASFSQYSYQRADERQYCAVHANYNDLLNADTLIWQNADFSDFWFIANITGFEWKNPNTVWIWFKLDAFMTFCGDINWSTSYCYVEREHVENDWNGNIPNFQNIGVPEGIGIDPSRTLTTTNRFLTPDRIVITSPYDQSGGKTSAGTMQNGVYTGLNSYSFTSAAAANAYLQAIQDSDDANIENVVSIQTVPSAFLDGTNQNVNAPTAPWNSFSDINNAKTFSGEFCLLRISSLCGSDKYYRPEYFSNPNNIQFIEYDTFAGGTGGIVLRPVGYMSSSQYEDSFVINDYPSGVAIGDTYAQWCNTNGAFTVLNGILGAVSAVAGGISGQGSTSSTAGMVASSVTAISSGIQSGLGIVQEFANQKKYGTVMQGTANANANFAAGLGAYGYSISWCIPWVPDLYALDDYFTRFGYLVNRVKVPNRNNRAHWNYVKCAESHVQGNMPYSYRRQIEGMLNSGVTFWNEGTTIGDYSNKIGNRG